MIVKLKHLLAIVFTTLLVTTSTSLEEEEEEEEVHLRSSQPSLLPSVCPFCSTTNGITILPLDSNDDDNGGINDTFEYELCQRLAEGAQVITANSTYCEKLLVAEQLCCPNDTVNGNSSGEKEEKKMMSLDYSFLYWYHAKVSKNEAKVRKGRRRGKSRGAKKKVRGL